MTGLGGVLTPNGEFGLTEYNELQARVGALMERKRGNSESLKIEMFGEQVRDGQETDYLIKLNLTTEF